MNTRRLYVATALLWCGFVASDARGQQPAASEPDQSAALFTQMMPVLTSPRCMNCHTATNFPRQGDDGHRHIMLVVRGPDDHGSPSLRCQTCHRDANSPNAGVPGALDWSLAPLTMAWEGSSAAALCQTMLDPQNGQRAATLVAHMQTPLVQWAWSPGLGLDGNTRRPPPMSSEAFISLVAAWVQSGAHCPRP